VTTLSKGKGLCGKILFTHSKERKVGKPPKKYSF
jgi:hypothetical protein